LAIRYGNMLTNKGAHPASHVVYERNVFVWSKGINHICVHAGVIRKHYYTSVQGDEPLRIRMEETLKSAGIEAPRVFKKDRARGSKRVDISLATDMLLHASRKNYEVAVLVAGDEDYVPLIEAVKLEGRRVLLWFIEDGLSAVLRRAVDRYADLGEILFAEQFSSSWR
jgi:uncharacterized LabA/DUF88 family protein